MSLVNQCRECRTALHEDERTDRLCGECSYLAVDYRRYDELRAEGYMPYQAKLMAGLADPPDPDAE
ncbi:MAG TPA: hypothetical protein VGC62_16255 [Pseudomonas sp.]|uniref:hypothetical protein n=1 Tax=Pseudomonas sp. TaxID=306 RepID=UPI002EDA4EDA